MRDDTKSGVKTTERVKKKENQITKEVPKKGQKCLAGDSHKKWEDTSSVNHILVLICNTTTERIMNLQDQQFSF